MQLNISCKRHMWSTTYELLNPCGFTHLVVRDNDVAFFCKVQLHYQQTFLYFMIILKFHVINFQRVMCKVQIGVDVMSTLSFNKTWCYKGCFHIKVTLAKKFIHMCSTMNGTWPKVNWVWNLLVNFLLNSKGW